MLVFFLLLLRQHKRRLAVAVVARVMRLHAFMILKLFVCVEAFYTQRTPYAVAAGHDLLAVHTGVGHEMLFPLESSVTDVTLVRTALGVRFT